MAQPDPTILEVLNRDSIKKICKSELIAKIKEFIKDCNPQLVQGTLDEDAEEFYTLYTPNRNMPENSLLDDDRKEELKTLLDEMIKKADEDIKEALASNLDPGSYRAVTMNMDGTKASGVTDHRREMICYILRNCVSDVVFCQELPGYFDENVVQVLSINNRELWRFTKTGNEAGVLWNKQRFEGSILNFLSTDTRMTQIRDSIIEENDLTVQDLLSRASFVKLTERLENEGLSARSFIAVSYHGEHTRRRTNERHQIFGGLIKFTRRLCQEEGNIPFLIGGDFNFDTTAIELRERIAIAGYQMSSRSEKPAKIPYKDNFFWESKALGIQMKNVRPFDITSGVDCDFSRDERDEVEDLLKSANPKVKPDDILDHDPIIGILQFDDTPANESSADDAAAGDAVNEDSAGHAAETRNQLAQMDLNAD